MEVDFFLFLTKHFYVLVLENHLISLVLVFLSTDGVLLADKDFFDFIDKFSSIILEGILLSLFEDFDIIVLIDALFNFSLLSSLSFGMSSNTNIL